MITLKKLLLAASAASLLLSSCASGKHEYRNYLLELGYTQEQIDNKLLETYNEVFHSERAAYKEVGDDLGYVADVKNNDVRTEGQSYGMMVAVQATRICSTGSGDGQRNI